jgi:hypothetical protein
VDNNNNDNTTDTAAAVERAHVQRQRAAQQHRENPTPHNNALWVGAQRVLDAALETHNNTPTPENNNNTPSFHPTPQPTNEKPQHTRHANDVVERATVALFYARENHACNPDDTTGNDVDAAVAALENANDDAHANRHANVVDNTTRHGNDPLCVAQRALSTARHAVTDAVCKNENRETVAALETAVDNAAATVFVVKRDPLRAVETAVENNVDARLAYVAATDAHDVALARWQHADDAACDAQPPHHVGAHRFATRCADAVTSLAAARDDAAARFLTTTASVDDAVFWASARRAADTTDPDATTFFPERAVNVGAALSRAVDANALHVNDVFTLETFLAYVVDVLCDENNPTRNPETLATVNDADVATVCALANGLETACNALRAFDNPHTTHDATRCTVDALRAVFGQHENGPCCTDATTADDTPNARDNTPDA